MILKFYKIIFAAVFFTISSILIASAPKDQCFVCHNGMEDGPSVGYRGDVHYEIGFSCADCHGGDSKSDDMEEAMSLEKGFIGVPVGDEISAMCIKCHSSNEIMSKYNSSIPRDQYSGLKNSIHFVDSQGKPGKIIQCISCHGVHGIKRVSDPKSSVNSLNIAKTCSSCHSDPVYMRTYNTSIATDQYSKYLTSRHGMLNSKGDSKVADCADCHGSHEIRSIKDVKSKVFASNIPSTCSGCHSDAEYMAEYHIPTNQFDEYAKSPHGIALLEKDDFGAPACNDCHGNHGAIPPNIESISQVCGSCHVLQSQLYSKSVHKKPFIENDLRECETCHGNHSIEYADKISVAEFVKKNCTLCHSADDDDNAYKTAIGMVSVLDSLDVMIDEAEKLVDDAEQKGMEVGEEKFKLGEIKHAKIESKTIIHTFNLSQVDSLVHNKGLDKLKNVIQTSQSAIDSYFFRRIGLLISLIVISFLAFSLYLYIKDLEKNKKKK